MKFTAYGHPNITSTHRNTFEFTKDEDVTKTGDCIVGVKADFSLKELKELLNYQRIKISIIVGNEVEEIMATPNKTFDSNQEMVIRKTEFASDRTFAIKADKASVDLKIRNKLKDPDQKITVEIKPL